jgi:LysR family transcriptional regulator, low CO2-responsive transcriptional regulator
VPRRHPLARRRAVTAAALSREPYIARGPGSSSRAVAEAFFERRGVSMTPAMELGSTEAVREAVAAGLGISVVSRHAMRARDTRVVAMRLQGERCMRDLLVIQRAGAPLSPAAARLQEYLDAATAAG